MNKVEFKKSFDLGGYEEIAFSANDDETTIWIKNKYSCPSSTISSTIVRIEGSLFEEKRWGFIFSDLVEVESDIDVEVCIELDRYEIDEDDFDEDGFMDEGFLEHLSTQAAIEILDSEYATVLKKLTAI